MSFLSFLSLFFPRALIFLLRFTFNHNHEGEPWLCGKIRPFWHTRLEFSRGVRLNLLKVVQGIKHFNYHWGEVRRQKNENLVLRLLCLIWPVNMGKIRLNALEILTKGKMNVVRMELYSNGKDWPDMKWKSKWELV